MLPLLTSTYMYHQRTYPPPNPTLVTKRKSSLFHNKCIEHLKSSLLILKYISYINKGALYENKNKQITKQTSRKYSLYVVDNGGANRRLVFHQINTRCSLIISATSRSHQGRRQAGDLRGRACWNAGRGFPIGGREISLLKSHATVLP